MISKLLLVLVFLRAGIGLGQRIGFTLNGFRQDNLTLDGVAAVTPNGLLRLTNETTQSTGHAFYPDSFPFKNTSEGSVSSFSTTFVFAIMSHNPVLSGHGIAFVLAPQRGLPGALPSQFLGLFNENNQGNETDHIFAIELDTIENTELRDINNNHVGININDLESTWSAPAGYYPDDDAGEFKNLSLVSGKPMQVWVDYDGIEKEINVTLAPFKVTRPSTPLMSKSLDLSPTVKETMFVGFSSSTGSILTSHYILGWSFQMNGQVQELDLSKLPNLPPRGKKSTSKLLTIGLPVLCLFLLSVSILGLFYYLRMKRKFAEVLEDWELECGPHRFKYKDLHIATRGFKDQELLGSGGFGRVYRGILPTSKIEIAVKRFSHDSRQGIRQFVAEIISIGRLRHRNLVTLLGYCRRKGELLLVYDYMPNGSLEKYLFNQPRVTLSWTQRFKVMKGVASGLLYLHEEWEQVVIHCDIKASNVLLDAEMNGRLGDFGLAKMYGHGTDPQSSIVRGTLGYLAPELMRAGRATKATDVFAFGVFLLEVATGKKPMETQGPEDSFLVDWVFSFWNRGEILEARDPRLGGEFVAEEVELVLKLGLMCSHSEPRSRPTVRQVVHYLEGDMQIEDLSQLSNSSSSRTRFAHQEGFDDFVTSYPSSISSSLLSAGR